MVAGKRSKKIGSGRHRIPLGVSPLNEWFDDWRGYAFDEPSGEWPEAKYGSELERSERPQGIQPSRPVGAEKKDDSHCMIPRRAIGHVGWDNTVHEVERGCQP